MRRGGPACWWIAVVAVCTGCVSWSGDDTRGHPGGAGRPAAAVELPGVLPGAAGAGAAGRPGGPRPEVLLVAAPAAPARRVAPPGRRFTIAVSGDVLPHSPLVDQAWGYGGGARFDFRPMFAEVAPVIGWADLGICHLETPVAPPGEQLTTFPAYGVPVEIAEGIASAGFDRCSTASNHTLDRGVAGIDATVAALEAAGLGQSGMARHPGEAVAPILDVAGVAVAHLSYTYGFNGFLLPAAEPWRSNPIDPLRIVADALDARARGAEVVLVSLHWGAEREAAPTVFQRDVAAAITASGAVDLIIGHHAHVLQPIELVNGRWVIFGLGNFLSNMPTGDTWPASSQDGAIVTVAVSELPGGGFAVEPPMVVPTWVDRTGGFVIRPVLAGLADPATPPDRRAALEASLQRTAAVVGGHLAPG